MERIDESVAGSITTPDTCDRCLRVLKPGWSFGFKVKPGDTTGSDQGLRNELTKCLLCSMQHWPMLKKSLAASIVVGTVLTALNQGDILLAGQWTSALWWKIPLTYTVPFLVATYGALSNNRR